MEQTVFEQLQNDINDVLKVLPIERGYVKELIDKAKETINQKFEELKDFDTWKEWKNK